MLKNKNIFWIVTITLVLFVSANIIKPEWGFFGHRKINRMAVFTLPPEMIKFYKQNIEYITEHAVDPDKRRYATKREAVRHYIDIDAWGEKPFQTVPKLFEDALTKYAEYYYINNGDTTHIDLEYNKDTILIQSPSNRYHINTDTFRAYFRSYIRPQYYEDIWLLSSDTVDILLPNITNGQTLYIKDEFSKEGILPYYMNTMYYKLISAFENQDYEKILRTSAEFGHYIGDAHVPLHTTRNYNGQLTDQVGIHAFWESRLPELFADNQYSFLVGKAKHIERPISYFWNMVYQSHRLLKDVLALELELKAQFPEDQQLCYDDRLERTIKTQCPEFSEAYHNKLNGMVESRMQDAIYAIGCVWYSAWVDAGQPDLNNLKKAELKEEKIVIDPSINTRSHSN
ncbi:MAG: zinc dependent phospholipase C family protein [Saprospiraceae bacterium]